MEITEEYISDVVARRPKEIEYYVGLQRFRNANDAFKVMDDDWGERNSYGCAHLVVGEDSFLEQIYFKIAERYYEYKTGKVDEDAYTASMGWNEEYHTDYMLTFNFFIRSSKNGYYYTSRMEYGDDFNSVPSDRQWGIYNDLFYSYKMPELAKEITDMLDKEVKADYGDEPLDDGFFDLSWNCFVEHYDNIKEKVYGTK